MVATGVAFWISTLITEPIKALMRDMQEVSSGNLEHQTVPRSKDEVGLLAATFNRMTHALRAAHMQELEAKALEHDLEIASEIQSNLVPKRMLKIPGYDVSAYYRPSKEVGGDYYDFITIDDDNEGIIVADVSGKGVPGSLVMSMARAFIRMEAERSRNVSPADTLVRANRMLAQDIKKGMFVTALYCILNKKTNEVRVASAGHNPLVVWRAAAGRIERVNPNGIALGFDKGPVFERTIKEERIVLGHGDRIVAYTDGVVEAMNARNQEFGEERFHALIRELAGRDSNQLLNLIVRALDEHRGNAAQSDDITIVTLRYL
jgi:sigma-B regulation protein RsbU (phosphoserine phosphatase)